MRRALTILTTCAIAAVVLTGCTPPQNEDAAEAAEAYSKSLTAWAGELADATAAEEPLADILAAAPELEQVGGVENTPGYLAAQDVAAQIDLVAAELSGIGDEYELYDLADEMHLESTFDATVDHANADRIDAISASWDLEDKASKVANRDAHTTYWRSRAGAVDDEITLNESMLDPDAGLQASFLAFNLDWLAEERAFDKQVISDLGTYTQFTNAYLDVVGTVSSGFSVVTPYLYAEPMTAEYAALAEEFAATLADVIETGTLLGESERVPSIADPYRTILIDEYIPIGTENSNARSAVIRLWMLWRIRELEKTPDTAYEAARTMLLEEVNRRPGDQQSGGSAFDPRPGSGRLLDVVTRFGQSLTGTIEHDDAWITELEEVYRYTKTLRDHPMIDEVAEAFDDVLALQREQIDAVADLVAANPDDLRSQIYHLIDAVADDLYEAALPAVRYLDNDAEFSEDLAALIEATSPTASASE